MNTESQTDRITQLEAACAAMREALESVVGHANRRQLIATEGTEDPELHRLDEPDFVLLCKQALSTDAGKSLLEKYQFHLTDNQRLKGELERVCDRLNKAEAELVIGNQSIAEMQPALGKLKDQLQAVEKERDSLQVQRDQVLHLLSGGELTEKEVIESGLGKGVLIEKRHSEYLRAKAENYATRLRRALENAVWTLDNVCYGSPEAAGCAKIAADKGKEALQPAQKDPQ